VRSSVHRATPRHVGSSPGTIPPAAVDALVDDGLPGRGSHWHRRQSARRRDPRPERTAHRRRLHECRLRGHRRIQYWEAV